MFRIKSGRSGRKHSWLPRGNLGLQEDTCSARFWGHLREKRSPSSSCHNALPTDRHLDTTPFHVFTILPLHPKCPMTARSSGDHSRAGDAESPTGTGGRHRGCDAFCTTPNLTACASVRTRGAQDADRSPFPCSMCSNSGEGAGTARLGPQCPSPQRVGVTLCPPLSCRPTNALLPGRPRPGSGSSGV